MFTFRRLARLLSIGLLLTAPAFAQRGPVVLTLNDAVDLALKEGYEARSLRLDLLRAEQDMASVRRSFLPNLAALLYTPNFSEGVTSIPQPNQLPIYNTTGTLAWNGYLTLTQALPTNGTLQITSNLQQQRQSVFNDALAANTKTKRFFTSLRVDFRQFLLVPNEQRLRLEQARLRLEQAQRQFTRIQLNVIYDVTAGFYALYSATRRLEIARENVTQQEQLFDLARKKFDAGLVPEVETLQAEVDLARSRNALLEAEGNAFRFADQLKLTLGLQLSDSEAVALRSYEISRARFENGGITVQDLALKRDSLTGARLDYLNAYIQYQTAVADLKRQTLYDFENDRSLVPESK